MRGHHRSSGIGRLDGDHGDIRIVVSAPPPQRKERAFAYLPWPVRILVKFGLPVLVLLAIVVLPNYLDCRSRHDSGRFFHGMTVSACTRQTVYGQIDATQTRFEAIARAVAGR
ncbi:hypothetical protein SAMN02799631_04103 [Methylobacterium sp. 174MFSha1.1]|uniref:hypothetical protein n=1 Tax=Methylobacterium sp. 174MFSha1.1 TaxID=1502749 RepID=UPI0008EA4F63|nr:hypothetical protein [Methylobacterium sp. 174MFSha1.1]SFV04389.1 hypothetical protein SAMN02799631_04103 [Methylobacterium sp. 174MFSha1.1]